MYHRSLCILLVTESFSQYESGGLVACKTAEILVQQGHRVVVYNNAQQDISSEENCKDVIYYQRRTPSSSAKHLLPDSELSFFRQILEREQPDVVHFCSFLFSKSRYLLQAALDIRKRVVLQPWIYDFFCSQGYGYLDGLECSRCASGNFTHAIMNNCGAKKTAVIHAISRYLLRSDALKSQVFLSTCSSMDRRTSRYGVPESKIVRLMLPFDRKRVEGFTVRDGTDFIYYGQMKDFKGVNLLPSITKICSNCSFAIYPANSFEVQSGLGLALSVISNVKIHQGVSWYSGLGAHLAACRGIMLPTLWPTSTEYVLMEALGMGKPIVAFNVGAHMDVLSHESNALVVPAGDTAAFADSINRLDRDVALRKRIGSGARETFESLTDDNKTYASLMQAYIGVSRDDRT